MFSSSRAESTEEGIDPITDFPSTSTMSLDSPDISQHSLSSGGHVDDSLSKRIVSPRICRLDATVYKKHRDRNVSLRQNLSEKFLKPVIATNLKKLDRLSQNISNHQTVMQDALFQSQAISSNLSDLMKQLEKFASSDHLKEIKTEKICAEHIVDMDSDVE